MNRYTLHVAPYDEALSEHESYEGALAAYWQQLSQSQRDTWGNPTAAYTNDDNAAIVEHEAQPIA